MGRRRLPTGGLLSLAVVLAALAVIVVAGAKHPTRVVIGPSPPPREIRVPFRVTVRVREPATPRLTGPTSVLVAGPTPSFATTTTTVSRTRPTSTPAGSGTTTTTLPPATTTTVPAAAPAPTSRTGVFEGGATTATARVGAVRTVTVTVPPGLRVTLALTCGLWHDSATAMTSVTLTVASGGAACVATFAIPPSSPQPAAWRLVSS